MRVSSRCPLQLYGGEIHQLKRVPNCLSLKLQADQSLCEKSITEPELTTVERWSPKFFDYTPPPVKNFGARTPSIGIFMSL